MVMIKQYAFPSKTGTGFIQARLYRPDCAVKPLSRVNAADNEPGAGKGAAASSGPLQLVQIVHGMAEHIKRYEPFCHYLASEGVAVCLHDQAGHGASVADRDKTGYFGTADGFLHLLDDVHETRRLALELLGQNKVQTFLLGHSMGSFISRCYCAKISHQLSGAIFSGTTGSNPVVYAGLKLAERSIRKNGPLYKDAFLARLTGQGFLKRIENPDTEVDWLTRDRDIVKAYDEDPLCGFTFTAAGYADLYRLLLAVSSKNWAKKMPADMPVYLFSGEQDPVGQYGKGPRQVYRWLETTGHSVTLKLYPEGRHEMLNETNRKQVWHDIMSWLNKHKNTEVADDHHKRSG